MKPPMKWETEQIKRRKWSSVEMTKKVSLESAQGKQNQPTNQPKTFEPMSNEKK